jgi:predicted MFS family arabinose efflux permease
VKSLAVGGLAAMAAAVGIGRFVYTPILPVMVADLGMSKATAGFIASANFLGYLAGALLAATPYVRGSRRAWLIAMLAVSAVTTGAMGLASSTAAFLVLRFVGGVASAFVLVFASALVLDRLSAADQPIFLTAHGRQLSDLSAIHFAGVGTGIVVSAVLVSALAWEGFGWRAMWLASGVAALLALAIVPRLVPERTETAAATTHGSRPRGLAPLVVAYGLFGFGYVITATFLVAIVRGSEQVRPLEPAVWIVFGVAAVPSVALWMWAGRGIGIARAFALACILESAGVAASVLWIDAAGILLAAALLGGTFMGLTALGLVRARQLASGDPRRTLAIMTAAFGLGQIVGPAFAGLVYDATGSLLAPSLVAVAGLVVAAGLVLKTTSPA